MTADPQDSLTIRPPLQKRSREAWNRVLDAGVAILSEGGYESFTIAAVCERANIPPRAIYARVDTKDALFLAVYEHGLSAVRARQEVFADLRWQELDLAQTIDRAVRVVAGIFDDFSPFLQSVVLISGGHEEVNRRGVGYVRELGDLFCEVILTRGGDGLEVRTRSFFDSVFSTLALRVAYGTGFVAPGEETTTIVDHLVDMGVCYLIDNR